jgi:hypothetical protein
MMSLPELAPNGGNSPPRTAGNDRWLPIRATIPFLAGAHEGAGGGARAAVK